jgi:hypothetical protein
MELTLSVEHALHVATLNKTSQKLLDFQFLLAAAALLFDRNVEN